MEFNVPFVDESIDLSEPGSAAASGAMLVGGFVVFYLASFGGRRVTNTIINATGMDDDGGVEVL